MTKELDLDCLAYETLRDRVKTNFIWRDGVFLPEDYNKIADAVENFQVYNDDVWVCSFQKSGIIFYFFLSYTYSVYFIIFICKGRNK